MDYQLTPEWTLSLPEGYQHRKEEQHLVFWTTGITLITTVFAYSGENQRRTLLANLRARAEADQLELIEDLDGDLFRLGYLQPETIRPGRTRLALHAFTTAPYNCLQTSFYLDRSEDLKTALIAWKSVQYTPEQS